MLAVAERQNYNIFALFYFVKKTGYTLQNLLQHGNDEGWETSDAPISGMTWQRSQKAVTVGMWMWNKPYIITRSDGVQVSPFIGSGLPQLNTKYTSVTFHIIISHSFSFCLRLHPSIHYTAIKMQNGRQKTNFFEET